LLGDGSGSDSSQHVYFAAVNAQLDPTIADELNIRSYPTTIYVKNGEYQAYFAMAADNVNKQGLIKWIKSVVTPQAAQKTVSQSKSESVSSASAPPPTPTHDSKTIPPHFDKTLQLLSPLITPELLHALLHIDVDDDESMDLLFAQLEELPYRALMMYPWICLLSFWLAGLTSGVWLYYLLSKRFNQWLIRRQQQPILHQQPPIVQHQAGVQRPHLHAQ